MLSNVFRLSCHPQMAEAILRGRWEHFFISFPLRPVFETFNHETDEARLCERDEEEILLPIFHTFFYSSRLFSLLRKRHCGDLYNSSESNYRLSIIQVLHFCFDTLCSFVCLCLLALFSSFSRMPFTLTSHLVELFLWSSEGDDKKPFWDWYESQSNYCFSFCIRVYHKSFLSSSLLILRKPWYLGGCAAQVNHTFSLSAKTLDRYCHETENKWMKENCFFPSEIPGRSSWHTSQTMSNLIGKRREKTR